MSFMDPHQELREGGKNPKQRKRNPFDDWDKRNRMVDGPPPMKPWTRWGFILVGAAVVFVALVAAWAHLLVHRNYDAVPRAIFFSMALMAAWGSCRIASVAKLKWLRYLVWGLTVAAFIAGGIWCWVSPWNATDVYNVGLVNTLEVLAQLFVSLILGGLGAAMLASYYHPDDSPAQKKRIYIGVGLSLATGLALALWHVIGLSWMEIPMWVLLAAAVGVSFWILGSMVRRR